MDCSIVTGATIAIVSVFIGAFAQAKFNFRYQKKLLELQQVFQKDSSVNLQTFMSHMTDEHLARLREIDSRLETIGRRLPGGQAFAQVVAELIKEIKK